MTIDVSKMNDILVTGSEKMVVSKMNDILITGTQRMVISKINDIIIIDTKPRRRNSGIL